MHHKHNQPKQPQQNQYDTKNTVYFDTSKLDKYGLLSNRNVEEQKAGARVEFDEEKKNISDFALWIKAPENHIMKWDSFFGKSYPGWHLECSAMGHKYLGENFVFIFKFLDNSVKKYIYNEDNKKEILSLCCEFAEYNFSSVIKMLKDNSFYLKNYFDNKDI